MIEPAQTLHLATAPEVTFVPERNDQTDLVERLYARAFGPGRHAKAASKLRETAAFEPGLSMLALEASSGALLGACRLFRARTRDGDEVGSCLLLGPIAVDPRHQGEGIGQGLCRACLDRVDAAGGEAVVLVGALAFFGPFGFEPAPAGRLVLPWPVDPARLLVRPPRGDGTVPAGRFL